MMAAPGAAYTGLCIALFTGRLPGHKRGERCGPDGTQAVQLIAGIITPWEVASL